MACKRLSAALAVLTIAGAGAATGAETPPAKPLKPATRQHLAAAGRAAGEDFPGPLTYCNNIEPGKKQYPNTPAIPEIRLRGGPPGQEPDAAKIFDNLYYVGVRYVDAWAIDTPEGIIVVDALNNKDEVATHIEGGLRKYGLDPARIKWVVLTHGHGDHYGGARYLQQKYKARVLMGEADWTLAYTRAPQDDGRERPERDQPPVMDMIIRDGMKLPGNVTLYLTPGHTLGTATLLFPVTDNGQKHMVALHGGSGFGFAEGRTPERFAMYADSNERFMKIALAAGADVPLSNHPENDLAIVKVDKLKTRGPGEPNPFVMGQDGVRRLFTAFIECARAQREQMID